MSAWAWLVVCWAGVLGGFILGAWWAHGRYLARQAEDDGYVLMLQRHIDDLDNELDALRDARRAEWERKIDAGGGS